MLNYSYFSNYYSINNTNILACEHPMRFYTGNEQMFSFRWYFCTLVYFQLVFEPT